MKYVPPNACFFMIGGMLVSDGYNELRYSNERAVKLITRLTTLGLTQVCGRNHPVEVSAAGLYNTIHLVGKCSAEVYRILLKKGHDRDSPCGRDHSDGSITDQCRTYRSQWRSGNDLELSPRRPHISCRPEQLLSEHDL